MADRPLGAIEEHFGKVSDSRIERTKEHKQIDILVIAICAVNCRAEGWVDIENYGKSKTKWMKTFLELPHGIPSHDTFGRVFALLDPQEFHCLTGFQHLLKATKRVKIPLAGSVNPDAQLSLYNPTDSFHAGQWDWKQDLEI